MNWTVEHEEVVCDVSLEVPRLRQRVAIIRPAAATQVSRRISTGLASMSVGVWILSGFTVPGVTFYWWVGWVPPWFRVRWEFRKL